MSVYRVIFFKKVADSTGHLFNPVQGAIEVHAENSSRAVELARQEFAKQKQVHTWTLRADSEQAQLLPGRKRAHLDYGLHRS